MIEVLHKSRVAALASLDTFLALLETERIRGHTSKEVETAFFADFHERLLTASYWGTGLNGSNKSNKADDTDVVGVFTGKDS